MSESNKALYERIYNGRSPMGERPLWEFGGPQPAFVELEKEGSLTGHVLDVGCGTGELSVHLALTGHTVTGIDLSPTAVERARARASERGAAVEFVVGDVLEPADRQNRFDTAVDSGTFHTLPEESRTAYAAALHRACRPQARLYLLTMDDESHAGMQGELAKVGFGQNVLAHFAPLGLDRIKAAFEGHWTVESVRKDKLLVRLPSASEVTELSALLVALRRG